MKITKTTTLALTRYGLCLKSADLEILMPPETQRSSRFLLLQSDN